MRAIGKTPRQTLEEKEEVGDDEGPAGGGDRRSRPRAEDGCGEPGAASAPLSGVRNPASSEPGSEKRYWGPRSESGTGRVRSPGAAPLCPPSPHSPAHVGLSALPAGLPGVRGNAVRLEQLPAQVPPHWLCARDGTKAAADWLTAPAPAERDWEAECMSDLLGQDGALPVRAVSGGPGAGVGWHPQWPGPSAPLGADLSPPLACPWSPVPSERAVRWTILTSRS